MVKKEEKFVECFKGVELAMLDGKTKPTIYHNRKKYVRVKVKSKRSEKGYGIRYIRKSDLDKYFDL